MMIFGLSLDLFFEGKGQLKNKVVELIKELENENIQVKFLRFDDAGEHYALGKECKQQNLESSD
jgi:hypothetical protein